LSENKIGSIAPSAYYNNSGNHQLSFSVSASPPELTIKRGQSVEIKVNISTISTTSLNTNVDMLASGTFSEPSFSLEPMHTKDVSFIFTPATDLGPGEYTLMLGAQNDAITVMKAVKINILD
jgi:virginiamycin B lyase